MVTMGKCANIKVLFEDYEGTKFFLDFGAFCEKHLRTLAFIGRETSYLVSAFSASLRYDNNSESSLGYSFTIKPTNKPATVVSTMVPTNHVIAIL